MKTLSRVPLIAIILLVILRMSIGWQFVYEGLWKLQTLKTNDPWTSEGYLKNAQGPLRDYFRGMPGDPDDLRWLDYTAKSRDWYNWRDRFVEFYGLNDEQKNKLNVMLDGSAAEDTAPDMLPPIEVYTQRLNELPEGLTAAELPSFAKYDDAKKTLSVTGILLSAEEARLLNAVDAVRTPENTFRKRSDPALEATPAEVAYVQAVERLGKQSRTLSARSKLAAHLRGNPEIAGVKGIPNERGSFDFLMGTITPDQVGAKANSVIYGKIQEYLDLVADYNQYLDTAKMSFQNDHATMLGRKIAIMKAELVTPVRVLEKDLKTSALELLSPEQLKKGALANSDSPLAQSDKQVMWGLIILGSMLLLGLGTRVSAVLGAIMLMMFYMVMPPWPGVPQAPGPEHSLIVNKNMIEAIALLAIAALPTGTWFGIDALFSRIFLRRAPAGSSNSVSGTGSQIAAKGGQTTTPAKPIAQQPVSQQPVNSPPASTPANPTGQSAPVQQTGSNKKNKHRR